jgi:hypothetical protein
VKQNKYKGAAAGAAAKNQRRRRRKGNIHKVPTASENVSIDDVHGDIGVASVFHSAEEPGQSVELLYLPLESIFINII